MSSVQHTPTVARVFAEIVKSIRALLNASTASKIIRLGIGLVAFRFCRWCFCSTLDDNKIMHIEYFHECSNVAEASHSTLGLQLHVR